MLCFEWRGVGHAYDIEDGSLGVGGELVLGGVSNKALLVCEGYPRRSDTVTWKALVSGECRIRGIYVASLP